MGLSSTHPQYDPMVNIWTRSRTFYAGEDAVKGEGEGILPATSGQRADGAGTSETSDGAKDYEAYKLRAIVPDNLFEAIDTAIGTLTKKDPEIIMPKKMESVIERATTLGESLPILMKRIYTEQLLTGRIGVLGDLDQANDFMPVMATYDAISMVNWNDSSDPQRTDNISFVSLNESSPIMNDETFEWQEKETYRALVLVDAEGNRTREGGMYATGRGVGSTTGSALEDIVIFGRYGTTLDCIPFEFINAADLVPSPSRPPMYGLLQMIAAIYRGEADYRQHVHTQGQDTLFTKGFELPIDPATGNHVSIRTGAGSHIHAPSENASAQYIGVDSTGLSESRTMLENDYTRASQKGGQVLDGSGQKESGDALRIRIAAQTIKLPNIALAGCAGVEAVLRKLAPLYGCKPDDIHIKPNLKFSDAEINMQELKHAVEAKTLGFPLSNRSLHGYAFRHGYTENTFEKELEEISAEQSDGFVISPAVEPAPEPAP